MGRSVISFSWPNHRCPEPAASGINASLSRLPFSEQRRCGFAGVDQGLSGNGAGKVADFVAKGDGPRLQLPDEMLVQLCEWSSATVYFG